MEWSKTLRKERVETRGSEEKYYEKAKQKDQAPKK